MTEARDSQPTVASPNTSAGNDAGSIGAFGSRAEALIERAFRRPRFSEGQRTRLIPSCIQAGTAHPQDSSLCSKSSLSMSGRSWAQLGIIRHSQARDGRKSACFAGRCMAGGGVIRRRSRGFAGWGKGLVGYKRHAPCGKGKLFHMLEITGDKIGLRLAAGRGLDPKRQHIFRTTIANADDAVCRIHHFHATDSRTS